MTTEAEEWLIALVPLHITNAPGSVPSTIRVARGERFQLDGDEAIDAVQLRRVHAFEVYTGSPEQEDLRRACLVEMEKERNNPLRRSRRRSR